MTKHAILLVASVGVLTACGSFDENEVNDVVESALEARRVKQCSRLFPHGERRQRCIHAGPHHKPLCKGDAGVRPDAGSPDGSPAICGDGVVQATEACDPPDGIVCDAQCQPIPIVCGNAIVQPGETCDPPDGIICDAQCQSIPIVCGNAIVQPGETCDPPDGIICDAQCQSIPIVCGNAIVQPGETCDPPNGSTCDSSCLSCDTNLMTDPANCGACGHVCPATSSSLPSCTNGVCGMRCLHGFLDCNVDAIDGCEVDPATDTTNCGSCGHDCGDGQVCRSGACRLAPVVDAGETHACDVINGKARCWGFNGQGQLGVDLRAPYTLSLGAQVVLYSGVTAIGAGSSHGCAIVNGGVMCWGANDYGQLGSVSASRNSPFAVPDLASGVTALAAKSNHTCVIAGGAAKCWGRNNLGQLGNNLTTDSASPVQVQGLTSGVQAIAVGSMEQLGTDRSCAVVNGGVKCWGSYLYGTAADSSPVPIDIPGISAATAIAIGAYHACAIVDGGLWCWGLANIGQPGEDPSPIAVPQLVPGLASGVTDVALGRYVTCAVVDGAVLCMGKNDSGEIGNGTTAWATAPTQVEGLTAGATAVAVGITASGNYACAVVNDQTKCWGANPNGVLGNGASTGTWNTPVNVVSSPIPVGQCPCTAGQTRCDPNGRGQVVCGPGAAGCGAWSPPGPCPNGMYCPIGGTGCVPGP